MDKILIVVHLIVIVSLCVVILLQRPEGNGFGMGGDPSSFLSGRGQANLLTRITTILGGGFFCDFPSVIRIYSKSASR